MQLKILKNIFYQEIKISRFKRLRTFGNHLEIWQEDLFWEKYCT